MKGRHNTTDRWARVALSEIVRTRSGNSKLIKGKLSATPEAGLFPAYSASGQDVWVAQPEHRGRAVIVSAIGARCGKAFLASGDWSAIANTHIVWPDEGRIDPEYLWLHLNNEAFWIRGGTAQPFVKVRETLKKRIPLPPLPTQRRIIERLRDAMATVRESMVDVERILRLTSKLRQATLDAAYSEASVTRPRKLSDLVSSLDQGWSPKCTSESTTDPETWAVITTTAVQPLKFDPFQNKILPSQLLPRPHLGLKRGDVLITRAGPRRRLGICCAVQTTKEHLLVCDKIYRLKVRRNLLLPQYLAIMLNASESLKRIERIKTGTSESGLNLTQSKLLDLCIPLREIQEQHEIVQRVQKILALCDRVAHETDRASTLTRNLMPRLVAAALDG